MANGSMSSNQSGEGEIRRKIIEADLVDCIMALPTQLFYTTGIPVCLWFLARDKKNHKFRDRRGETLFIDARKMGQLTDRTHRELTHEEIREIAGTYHAWRGENQTRGYIDKKGFCQSAATAKIVDRDHVLTPGLYVGTAEIEEDDQPFEEKMRSLAATLKEQLEESSRIESLIRMNLKQLGHDL
jgi:type I restriction enzyme M protein